MSGDDDIQSTTSVALTLRQIRWLKANVHNRSGLIRKLIDEHIVASEGYGAAVTRLEDRKQALLEELAGLEAEIDAVYMKQKEFEEQSTVDRDSRINRLKRDLAR